MPRSQAEVRWAFANQGKDAYADEVVSKVHEAGPGSVKRLPPRQKDNKPATKSGRPIKSKKFGSLAP